MSACQWISARTRAAPKGRRSAARASEGAAGRAAASAQRGDHALTSILIADAYGNRGLRETEIERIAPGDFLKRRDMHQLLRLQPVALPDRAEILMGADITMALPEGAVDLGNEGAGRAIAQRDPEAHGVEMEPQEARLGEQQKLGALQRKPAFGKDLAKPRDAAPRPLRPAMAAIRQVPEVEPIGREEARRVRERQIHEEEIHAVAESVFHASAAGMGGMAGNMFDHALSTLQRADRIDQEQGEGRISRRAQLAPASATGLRFFMIRLGA